MQRAYNFQTYHTSVQNTKNDVDDKKKHEYTYCEKKQNLSAITEQNDFSCQTKSKQHEAMCRLSKDSVVPSIILAGLKQLTPPTKIFQGNIITEVFL